MFPRQQFEKLRRRRGSQLDWETTSAHSYRSEDTRVLYPRNFCKVPWVPLAEEPTGTKKLSQFRSSVQYVPRKDNVVADAMSRWAYPAPQAGGDVSMHGNLQDGEEMKQILEDKKQEEKGGVIRDIALSEGVYVYRTQQLEDEFDSDSD